MEDTEAAPTGDLTPAAGITVEVNAQDKQDKMEVSLPLAAPDQESQPVAEQPLERLPELKPETEEFSEFIPGTTCKLDLHFKVWHVILFRDL